MPGQNEWNEKLFGCFDDCKICLCGWCCTPCLFGRNAEKVDGTNCVLMCCAYSILTSCYLCWIPHCLKRQDLRNKYGLREEPCGDCPTAFCCGPCALCQEARFINRQAYPAVVVAPAASASMTTTNQPRGHY